MKHRKILFIVAILLVVGFNFGSRLNVPEASAAVCVLKNITWLQSNAKNGDDVKFQIDGQDCSLDHVTVKVMLSGGVLSDSEITKIELYFPRAGAQNADKILGDWPVAISNVAIFNSKIYLVANLDSAGAGTQVDSTKSSIPYLVVAPPITLALGVTITQFSVTPVQINANQITELTGTFKAKADRPIDFYTRCSQVQAFMLDDSGNKIYTQSPQSVSATNPNYSFDFKYRYDAKGDGTINLRGKLECLVFGSGKLGATLPTSSPVCVAIGSGVCAGTGGAVCGNGQCESGETQSNCPADCTPGKTQVYPFEIPNPLKGGATDFAGLVKIIAQWIFNLAIPIAVAMIVYAGILFLTAQGEPAKITKAKEVLKYAVIGLAIILIGSGFVTLVQSILELGGTGTTQTQNQNPGSPSGPQQPATTNGAVGNICSKDSNCFTGLVCKNTICQRAGGNLASEACVGPTNCASGLDCDKSDAGIKVIDGQTLGSCIESANPAPIIITANETSPAVVGQAYTMDLSATGGGSTTFSWSVVGGTLPPGLNLSVFGTNNGNTISGIPETAGTYTFVLNAKNDTTGQSGGKSVTIKVNKP